MNRADDSCSLCAKRFTCPKAEHFENYSLRGSCMDFEEPDITYNTKGDGDDTE
jgi:hypothetical protein